MDNQYDVIIIGSGPAGLTAAIYAARANLKAVIFESEMPGGKLTKTYEIENYPGIKKISGAELAMQMMDHTQSFGVEIKYSGVVDVAKEGDLFTVSVAGGERYVSKAVIVATGTREKTLQLEHAEDFTGHGISYCAVCDGAFYRNKDVVVIGGGNSALEEAIYLTQLVNKVYIVIRRDVFRADSTVVEHIRENPKIEIVVNSLPEELVIEDGRIVGLKIKNVKTNEITELKCEGIFPYIGADPAAGFLSKLNVLDERGYLPVNNDMETSVKGLYGAGDITVKNLRQVVTAVNDGAIAANSAARYLNEK